MSPSRFHGTARLLVVTLLPSAAIVARTIDTTPLPLCFDGIAEGTRFAIGATFAMPGANVTVRALDPVRGEQTLRGGGATVEGDSFPDPTKAGVHLSIRNAAVEIEFTELVSIVVLHFRDPGKVLDLAVNGDGVRLTPSDGFPSSLGGVELRIPPAAGDSRSIFLLGVMESVGIGGDALTLDCGYAKGILLFGAFTRGDADASGVLDLSDPIAILRFLFQGSEVFCDDAADANDDGNIDVTDPIFLLEHLFRGGSAPPEPNGLPGRDPTEDDLDCRPTLRR